MSDSALSIPCLYCGAPAGSPCVGDVNPFGFHTSRQIIAICHEERKSAYFTKYRNDGWPLCPACEEDELYSLYLITTAGIRRQAKGEKIELVELFRYPFACYRCNWHNGNDKELDYRLMMACIEPLTVSV